MKKPTSVSRRSACLGILLSMLALSCAPTPPEPASLVITGARVWTGDSERPWAEAIASRGETIIAVGDHRA